jgi:hypothetical protein
MAPVPLRGARIQGEQWYPVKVDRVNKGSICDDSRINLRDDACAKLGAENGVSIKKIRFVGRPNTDKPHCSIVLFLGSKQEADELIHRKYLEVDGKAAYTKTYERIGRNSTTTKCEDAQPGSQRASNVPELAM